MKARHTAVSSWFFRAKRCEMRPRLPSSAGSSIFPAGARLLLDSRLIEPLAVLLFGCVPGAMRPWYCPDRPRGTLSLPRSRVRRAGRILDSCSFSNAMDCFVCAYLC
jgi:hypothetical protein